MSERGRTGETRVRHNYCMSRGQLSTCHTCHTCLAWWPAGGGPDSCWCCTSKTPQLTAPRSSKKCRAADRARRRETSATCRQRFAVCRLSSALDAEMLLPHAAKHVSSSSTRHAALRALRPASILWLLSQAETGAPAPADVPLGSQVLQWPAAYVCYQGWTVGSCFPASLPLCWCIRRFDQCCNQGKG